MFTYKLRYFIFVLPASCFFIAPFYEPHLEDQDSYLLSNTSVRLKTEVKKRDDNCPINHFSCSALAAGYGGACCPLGFLCATDAAHQIACCTIGAKCTGKVDRPTTQTTEVADITYGGPPTITISPSSTTTSPTTTVSIVPNAYFPFPYIPTTYSARTACLSAYSACQTNYAACAANLQGTSYGVTIIAPAGGITVSPTIQDLGVSSATNICSSLSAQACHGIAKSDCDQFIPGFAVPTVSNAVVRPTLGAFVTAGMVAGIGWGIAGQIA